MVQVNYKGINIYFVGSYKIVAGLNEIKDEDFYKFMQTITFKFRVEQKIIEVPQGFPLQKPAIEKPSPISETSARVAGESEDEEKEEHKDRLSLKATFRIIEKAESEEVILKLLEIDNRPKVVEEAKKRLKALKK